MADYGVCRIDDCDKIAINKTQLLCENHYRRWKKHGDPLLGRPSPTHKPGGACSIEDCQKESKYRGLCIPHYMRQWKHGDALKSVRVVAPKGEPNRFLNDVVLPYRGDECLAWPYSCDGGGYGHIANRGKVHRIVCAKINGKCPGDEYQAAHSCGNGHLGCVNPNHLTWKTRHENQADRLIHGTHNRG